MNIADNLQHLETHYINVWIKKWRQQLEETTSTEERSQLLDNIQKAQREIDNRAKEE